MKILVGYIGGCKTSGIDIYLLNLLDSLNAEGDSVDFLTREPNNDYAKDLLAKKNAKLFQVSRNRHFIKQFREMRDIIRRGNYDIAYFNISESYNCVGILAAKLSGVKKIVVHSHSSGADRKSIFTRALARIVNCLCKPVVSLSSDLNLTCSDKAARWLYSGSTYSTDNFVTIYNGVDLKTQKPDATLRAKLRKQYGIEDSFVIGHIGRFSYVKNQLFLVKVLKKLKKTVPNAKLLLIGDGDDKAKVERYAKKHGLSNSVIFAGTIPNANQYLNACDCFVMPSHFEGMPFVGAEAQALGLPCIFSSKLTRSVAISNNAHFASIHRPGKWAKILTAFSQKKATKVSINQHPKQDIAKIIKNETSSKLNIASLSLKALLGVHYVLNLTAFFNGFNYLLVPSALLLVILIITKFPSFFSRKIKNLRFFLPLALFIVSYVVTFILSQTYELQSSIKILAWTLLYFFVLFDGFYMKRFDDIKLELYSFGRVLVASVFIVNLHNFLLLITKTSEVIHCPNGSLHKLGMTTWGRFYGNYYDPNYASVACVVVSAIALFLVRKTKNIVYKLFLYFSIILNLIYIFASESRTGLIALGAIVIAYSFARIISTRKNVVRTIVFGAATAAALTIAAPRAFIGTYNYLSDLSTGSSTIAVDTPSEPDVDDPTEEDPEREDDPGQELPPSNPQRPYRIGRKDSKADISNGRYAIWEDSFEITRRNPIFGIGFANMTEYTKDHMPESSVARRSMSASHNMLLDILFSQGVLGLIPFLAFVTVILVSFINGALKRADNMDSKLSASMLFACVATIATTSFFVSQILYINNLTTFLFWVCLGYLIAITTAKATKA